MKFSKLIILSLLLATSVSVQARGPSHFGGTDAATGPGHFGGQGPVAAPGFNYDTNNDGEVTPDEIIAARTSVFTAINSDTTDAGITFAEFSAWLSKKNSDAFTNLDNNPVDGIVSLDEYLAKKSIRKQDYLTRVFNLANTATVTPDPSAVPPVVDGLDATEFAVLGPQTGAVIRRFAALDANGDGVISIDEYLAAPGHHGRH